MEEDDDEVVSTVALRGFPVYHSFLPQSKRMHIWLNDDSNLGVDVKVSVMAVCLSVLALKLSRGLFKG